MNNSLYNNSILPNQTMMQNINGYPNNYVEEYLKSNLGNIVEAQVSFCDSIEWRDSIFKGKLENVGKDYIVIRDNQNSYVIWSIYIDYIVFNNNH